MRANIKSKFPRIRFGASPCAIALGLLLALAGCAAGPPVQEMSDARQAISVAREAGADRTATADLRAAEAYLSSALRKLTDESYKQAKEDALLAKGKALDALAIAEAADPNQPE